ncbi:MAG: AMP-binding protein [Leptospiraceae bacterium]|nr:AMP-binding protein [Leptospiraceae bacterium]
MKTIGELLKFRSEVHPNRKALFYEGKELTYLELFNLARKAGEYLKSLSLKKGDRFGVLDFNSEISQHILNGASLIGAIPIFINWRLTPSEIKIILEDSNTKILLYGEEFFETINSLSSFNCNNISIIDLDKFNSIQEEIYYIKEDDVYVQLYTSGTTGLPKGVPLTHKHMLAVLRNLATELPGFGADSINLVCAPFFHIGGVGYSNLGFFIGGENILVNKFDPVLVNRLIGERKITNALLVPAMIGAILNLADVEKTDYSNLRNIQFGGSPMPIDLLKKANSIFKCKFTQAYGLTETSGIASLLRYDEQILGLKENTEQKYIKRLASVGKPSPKMEIVIKLDNERKANTNELGEICIKGDYVFSGYWNRKDLNLDIFDKEGWFHTGDIGLIDEEGFIYIVDRKNDMILSKSENIYPVEIERALEGHPLLKDFAVVGTSDEEYGEIVTLFAIPAVNKDIKIEDIKIYLKDKLASYKIPRKIFIVNEIPRNPTGKVLRKELKRKV